MKTTTRKGLLGTKLGMTQVWDENNRIVPVTVIEAGPNVVTQVRTPETDGYSAVQLAFDPTLAAVSSILILITFTIMVAHQVVARIRSGR